MRCIRAYDLTGSSKGEALREARLQTVTPQGCFRAEMNIVVQSDYRHRLRGNESGAHAVQRSCNGRRGQRWGRKTLFGAVSG